MSGYPLFFPEFGLCTNSSLFWFKIANELSEFRNYLFHNSFMKSYFVSEGYLYGITSLLLHDAIYSIIPDVKSIHFAL